MILLFPPLVAGEEEGEGEEIVCSVDGDAAAATVAV